MAVEAAMRVGFFGLRPFFALVQVPGVERLGSGGDAGNLDSQAFCHGVAQIIRGVV